MTNSDAKDQAQIDQERESLARMRAITISREYGSGGGEIASRLARRLGWQLIDHEIVVRVAQELGVSEADAEEYDECGDGPLSRVLQSFRLVQPTMPVSMPMALTTDSRAYNIARCHAVMGAYAKGHTVIVGRGGQALLAQQRDVLHERSSARQCRRFSNDKLERRVVFSLRQRRTVFFSLDPTRIVRLNNLCFPLRDV